MPLLHIKQALDKEGEAFKYISKAKIEGGIFTGPDVRKMLLSQEFEENITSSKERNVCRSFREVAENSLGYNKSGNYKQFIKKKLIKIYEKIECLMTLKLHFPPF